MITRNFLLATLLLGAQAFAGTDTTIAPTPVLTQPEASPFFTGSFTAGYTTNYVGRGLVVTNRGIEGEGAEFMLLKLKHDLTDKWSTNTVMSYTISSSGHTLYGNPSFDTDRYPQIPEGTPIKEANLENQFTISQDIKYSEEKWNIAVGYDYIHGGLLGVMAKHYAEHSMSCVSEVFITPEYTPYKWMSFSCPVRFSFDGVRGWWFEPSLTFKAPLIGTPEDIKMAAVLSFNASFTADYFQDHYFACSNGGQAWWIQLSTPYFINEAKTWVFTPSVSFNWLGRGAMKANKDSHYKEYSGDDSCVPFKNFGVVGSFACTYIF